MVILADSSAIIAYLRGTESAADAALTRLIETDDPPVLTEPVVLEILAGARSRTDLRRIRRFLYSLDVVPVIGLDDNERAADLYRRCRANGASIRSLIDCLIAAVAIRISARVLHEDRDFEALAAHTELQTVTA